MTRVVHGADVFEDRDATPQSRGLLAAVDGFALTAPSGQFDRSTSCSVHCPLVVVAREGVRVLARMAAGVHVD
jgi:hypothetical protein